MLAAAVAAAVVAAGDLAVATNPPLATAAAAPQIAAAVTAALSRGPPRGAECSSGCSAAAAAEATHLLLHPQQQQMLYREQQQQEQRATLFLYLLSAATPLARAVIMVLLAYACRGLPAGAATAAATAAATTTAAAAGRGCSPLLAATWRYRRSAYTPARLLSSSSSHTNSSSNSSRSSSDSNHSGSDSSSKSAIDRVKLIEDKVVYDGWRTGDPATAAAASAAAAAAEQVQQQQQQQQQQVQQQQQDLKRRLVEFADGSLHAFDVTDAPPAVLALPWDSKKKKLTILREYCPGPHRGMLCVVAGLLEAKHKSVEDAVLWETEEEAGVRGGQLIPLMENASLRLPGAKYTAQPFLPFLVVDGQKVSEGRRAADADELLETLEVSVEEALAFVFRGEVTSTGSMMLLLGIEKLRKLNYI
ncbi:hypothetical protein Efla_005579 [Eimeria flavescens]